MKISEIRDKTKVELAAQGRELRMELFNLKLQKASSQLEIRLRELRHDIARIETQVTQLRRTEAMKNLITALDKVKDFTVDGVAGVLRDLAKDDLSRRDVLKICGSVFNKQRVRLTGREMAQLIQTKGRDKAVELVKQAAARN